MSPTIRNASLLASLIGAVGGQDSGRRNVTFRSDAGEHVGRFELNCDPGLAQEPVEVVIRR